MSKKKVTAAMAIVPVSAKALSTERTNEIILAFDPSFQLMREYEAEFNVIEEMKQSPARSKAARSLRLKYVKVRTGASKVHKPLKAVALAVGDYIDSFRNQFRDAAAINEDTLSNIENYEAVQLANQIAEKQRTREFDLAKYDVMVFPPNLGEFSDEIWDVYITGVAAKNKQDIEDRLQAKKELDATKEALKIATAPPPTVLTTYPETGNGVQETMGHDMSVSDDDKAKEFARRLKELRYAYTFTGDIYVNRFEYACTKIEAMEKYFTTTIKAEV
jgi:hypothetical protein